jgi:hypothetical protein
VDLVFELEDRASQLRQLLAIPFAPGSGQTLPRIPSEVGQPVGYRLFPRAVG